MTSMRLLGWSAVVGVLCGAASASFLWLLDLVTSLRDAHVQLVYALPLAGAVLGWIWQRWGKPIAGGTNLVIEGARDAGSSVPLRMAPLVLLGTLLTHAFGGSAGREGTAVQMGGSLADNVARAAKLTDDARGLLVVGGIAGGFGSVFGTPLAGVIFGIEVLVFGRWQWRALLPSVIAALVGDAVTRALGIAHTHYPRVVPVSWSWSLLGQWLVVALVVALCVIVFIELTHRLRVRSNALLPNACLRLSVGGACVVALWLIVGSDDHLGLGVPTIVRAFVDPALPVHMFALKLLFTVVTLGFGFIGGEVTPLFFIGATLGNALGVALGMPLDLAAAVGMVAMFGAASNAPIALAVMAFELFGVGAFIHALPVCLLSCALTGERSIYTSQRFALRKWRP